MEPAEIIDNAVREELRKIFDVTVLNAPYVLGQGVLKALDEAGYVVVPKSTQASGLGNARLLDDLRDPLGW